jgi:hypothetical protein
VNNKYGLRPAFVKGKTEITPMTAFRDVDKSSLLGEVTVLNFHLHLPYHEISSGQQRETVAGGFGTTGVKPEMPCSALGVLHFDRRN